MRFGHISLVCALASTITYSFQALAPAVNNLQSLSITYTYSQQLSGHWVWSANRKGWRYRETAVLVHNSVCNVKNLSLRLSRLSMRRARKMNRGCAKRFPLLSLGGLPSNPPGEMLMACGLQLIACLFPLFGSSAIRDLWIGLRKHEAGQPDWP
jgi:hypothetical protein